MNDRPDTTAAAESAVGMSEANALKTTAPSADSGGATWEIGSWLSAALDDPTVCDAMKAAITSWFDGGGYLRQALAQPAPQEDFSPSSLKGEDTHRGAEGAVVVPRDQLETLRRSIQLGNLLPGEGENLINLWIMASDAEVRA